VLDINIDGIGRIMTDEFLSIKIEGLKELIRAAVEFPLTVAKNMSQAGHEAGERVILPTRGLRNYPPQGAGNKPPTPYYIRGRGTQLRHRNLANSERYGTQFYVKRTGWSTHIGNRASYAVWLADKDKQAKAMAKIGWRKLWDVAHEKLGDIRKVYQAWTDKTLRDVGFK
jgi:hypothetical protein